MANRFLTPDELREEIRAVVRADAERAAQRVVHLTWGSSTGWRGGSCMVCGERYMFRECDRVGPVSDSCCLECRLASPEDRLARNRQAPWNRECLRII